MGKIRKAREKARKAKARVAGTIRPGFWKQVMLAFSPKNYSELSERSAKKGVKYILALLLASFIIMCIMAMPKIMVMPQYIESELANFEKLNISIEMETSTPVRITGEDPQIIIDSEEREAMGDEKLLIAGNYLYYKPYGATRAYNISEYSNVLSSKKKVSRLVAFAAILLIPTILITSYIMFLVKYAITIAAFALLLFVFLRIAKRDLGLKKSLNVAIYASTPMILIEVIFIPFNSKYLVPLFQFMGMNYYLATLAIYAALALPASYFAMKKKKKKKEGEEYPEMEGAQWGS